MIPVSLRKRSSLGLTTTLAATKKMSTSQSMSSEQLTKQTRPYQPTQGTPKYSTYLTLTITKKTKSKDITSPILRFFTSMDIPTGKLIFTLRYILN